MSSGKAGGRPRTVAPGARILARATTQPVVNSPPSGSARLPRNSAAQPGRKLSLEAIHVPTVPEYVVVEGESAEEEGEGRIVSKKVYVTEVNGICTLDLYSGCNSAMKANALQIKQLPAKLCTLVQLERLWASHNLLSSLPPKLSHLSNLRELLLHQNNFTLFPSVVCQLCSLQLLWLSSNNIASIPPEISHLSTLRRLHLDHNLITELPNSLCEMSRLEVLYLNHNRLSSVCSEVGKLTSLRRLFLQHNQISQLPLSMCELSAIERLNLDHNSIKHLTAEFQLYQTEKNGGGMTRVSTRNNPFETPITRMKKPDSHGSENSLLRARTLSFPLPTLKRHADGHRSPSPNLRPLNSQPSEEEEWPCFERKVETLPRVRQ